MIVGSLFSILADRTAARSYWHDIFVCLSVRLSVTLWIVAKRKSHTKSVWTGE